MSNLWRHPGFLKLWAGQSISVFGSVAGMAAMAFTAILFLHATPFQLGILAAARLVPGFLVGLPAGAWIDRFHRRPILIVADVGRALVLGSIPLAAFFGILRIEQLYAVTFLVGIMTLFFDVAYQSYLPTLIDREDLIDGNSKLSATASIAEVGGFSIAGWLVQRFTAPIAILVDAISFGVSAFSVWLIHAPEPPLHNERLEMLEGVKVVWHDPTLRSLAACNLSRDFCVNIYGTLVLLYMTRDLGFKPGVLGAIFAVGGLSSFFGASLTQFFSKHFGTARSMMAGLALFGVSLLFVPLAQGATLTAATLLVLQQLSGDGAATVYQINQMSLRQSVTPDALQGRVNAGFEFLRLGGSLAGSLAGGFLGAQIGVRATLFCGAIGVIVSAGNLFRLPRLLTV